ncbi:MAG: hypothetical protein LBB53_06620, partial [Prevotellaceae bacterium]|nr:hypothetical protein [Prevotellaceae bacterium]
TALSKINELTAKAAVLAAMLSSYEEKGFKNCANVQQIKAELSQIQFDKYKDRYPNYLFFTDEQFEEIVKRNNLVISTSEAYTGEIPEHCWEAIQQENIDKEDIRENKYVAKITSSKTENWFTFDCNEIGKTEISNFSKEDIENYILQNKFHYTDSPPGIYSRLTKYDVDRMLYGELYAKYNSLHGSDKDECKFAITFTINNDYSQLYIAAPVSMIDKSKEKKLKIFEQFHITRQEQPKDPIVFRYVKDGILVITFWK